MNDEPKKISQKKVLIIVISILVIGGIIAVVAGNNKEKNLTKAPVETVQEVAPEEVSTTATAPAPATTWQTVMDVTSNTSKRTGSFYLGSGQKKLLYNVTGGDSVICGIYLMKEGESLEQGGGSPEVTVDNPGPGETALVNEPGNYYLDVKAANCNWQVTIQELK